MRILCFGAGGLTRELSQFLGKSAEVLELGKAQCDVRDYHAVRSRLDMHRPDFVIGAAGLSDLAVGTSIQEVLDVNLKGAIYVGSAASSFGTPSLLIASTAGMEYPALHPVYGAAKAGVIAWVASAGKRGVQTYCLSPNRMDTPMRDADWPDEDLRTRLSPFSDVCPVIRDIMKAHYPWGANVVVRKVGVTGRVDVFQAPTLTMEGMLDVG